MCASEPSWTRLLRAGLLVVKMVPDLVVQGSFRRSSWLLGSCLATSRCDTENHLFSVLNIWALVAKARDWGILETSCCGHLF